MPANGIVGEQVAEEAGDIAQLVGLVAMDGVVVLGEGLLIQLHPHAVQARKLLAQQAHELGINLLLRTRLDDHGYQLGLLAGGELKLHQFVSGFLGIGARLDGQVDSAPQVDKVGVRLVSDLDRLLLFVL